jgi:hypothetical protein
MHGDQGSCMHACVHSAGAHAGRLMRLMACLELGWGRRHHTLSMCHTVVQVWYMQERALTWPVGI